MTAGLDGRLVRLSKTGHLARVLGCCGVMNVPMVVNGQVQPSPSAIFVIVMENGEQRGHIFTGVIDGAELVEES